MSSVSRRSYSRARAGKRKTRERTRKRCRACRTAQGGFTVISANAVSRVQGRRIHGCPFRPTNVLSDGSGPAIGDYILLWFATELAGGPANVPNTTATLAVRSFWICFMNFMDLVSLIGLLLSAASF